MRDGVCLTHITSVRLVEVCDGKSINDPQFSPPLLLIFHLYEEGFIHVPLPLECPPRNKGAAAHHRLAFTFQSPPPTPVIMLAHT